jgi:hypothetical protein
MTTEEDDALRLMAEYEAAAEKVYDEMYHTRYPIGCYSEFKDLFAYAIGAATRAGRPEDVERLNKRLEHCKAVYRSQFSQF